MELDALCCGPASSGRRRTRPAPAVAGQPLRRRGAAAPPRAPASGSAPRVVGGRAEGDGELARTALGQQRRVVGRVALGGQPEALDGVGEHHRRTARRRRARKRRAAVEVVPAEVAQRGARPRRRAAASGPRAPRAVTSAAEPLGGRAQQPLVLLVAHGVDAVAQLARRRRGRTALQQPAVLRLQHLPPRGGEHALPTATAMSGTIRSSDWRLRSTTHSTSPSRCTIGSATHSQIAPSSSSASPRRLTCRPPGATSPRRAR